MEPIVVVVVVVVAHVFIGLYMRTVILYMAQWRHPVFVGIQAYIYTIEREGTEKRRQKNLSLMLWKHLTGHKLVRDFLIQFQSVLYKQSGERRSSTLAHLYILHNSNSLSLCFLAFHKVSKRYNM